MIRFPEFGIPNMRFFVLIFLSLGIAGERASSDEIVRVILMAGQSNMEGQGVVDLDHPKYYNGGKGILNNYFKSPGIKERFPYIQDKTGQYVVRNDVFVRFQTRHGLKKGGLSIGFAGYPGKHHIGPEFQFGHLLGEHFQDKVLLIKTAWGGKSLYKDFRPPSLDGPTGPFYSQMISEFQEGLEKLPSDFPELKDHKVVISGFVWFQGWNDMFDQSGRQNYADNLVHLVKDVRKELNQPNLLTIVGELGNGGDKAGPNMKLIRAAQKEACEKLGNNVQFVPTTQCARPSNDSPNVSHGHHWFGNAESYFLIGDAMGHAYLKAEH